MSARRLTNKDRKRRAAWARRIAADQRREAERAAAILRNIMRQIVEGDNRLNRRITKELTGGPVAVDKYDQRLMRAVRRERQR